MAMVGVANGSLQVDSAEVDCLALRVGSQLALNYIHHMNRVNSRNDSHETTL